MAVRQNSQYRTRRLAQAGPGVSSLSQWLPFQVSVNHTRQTGGGGPMVLQPTAYCLRSTGQFPPRLPMAYSVPPTPYYKGVPCSRAFSQSMGVGACFCQMANKLGRQPLDIEAYLLHIFYNQSEAHPATPILALPRYLRHGIDLVMPEEGRKWFSCSLLWPL